MKLRILTTLFVYLLLSGFAFAGDGATVAFKGGQVAFLPNGYKELIKKIKRLKKSDEDVFVEFSLGGGTFLINVAEIIMICRDTCTGLEFVDVRDEARGRR